MKMPILFICLFILVAGLSGCGTPGFPKQSYDPNKQIQQLEDVFNRTDLIQEYYATNADVTVQKNVRNKMIDSRLALINLNYNQFIARFAVKKQSLDFGTEVTQLGLNLATTAVGGEETKTILAAVASGVTGSKLALDKNFFFEKTVPVLISSMNAQRKVMLLPIVTGMKQNTDDYSFAQALSDLDAYYFAGTFVGALQAIQADAGNKEVKANEELNKVRKASFTTDDAGQLLEDYYASPETGTVTATAGTNLLVGTGTHFTTELGLDFQIIIEDEVLHLQTIMDDEHLATVENFATNYTAVSYQAVDPRHEKAIQDWLDAHQLPDISVGLFVWGDAFSDVRKKAATDLQIKKP